MQILGGIHQRKKLFVPKSRMVRPTIARLKKSIFDILQEDIASAEVLDLFAGVGGLGLEALSRGASSVTFVEKEPLCTKALQRNIQSLDAERHCRLIPYDIFEALSTLSKKKLSFDLIFADPPYGEGYGRRILVYLDNHPLLRAGGSLFLEERFTREETLPELSTLTIKSHRVVGKTSLIHLIKVDA